MIKIDFDIVAAVTATLVLVVWLVRLEAGVRQACRDIDRLERNVLRENETLVAQIDRVELEAHAKVEKYSQDTKEQMGELKTILRRIEDRLWAGAHKE